MKINDELYLEKKAFVAELSKLLNIAKPHLTCEFKLGEELPIEDRWVDGKCIKHQPSGEFVIVTCSNGYQYKLDITANSLAAIAEEVFKSMICK